MNLLRTFRPFSNMFIKCNYSSMMVTIHPDELYNLKNIISNLEREYKKTINKVNILEHRIYNMENKNRYNIEPKINKLEDKIFYNF